MISNEKRFLQRIRSRLEGPESEKAEFSRDETGILLKIGSKYLTLYEIGKLISSEIELGHLLKLAMDKVIEVTGAQRGLIGLVSAGGEVDFRVARCLEKSDIEQSDFEVSRSIIRRAIVDREAICLRDAMADQFHGTSESVTRLRLLSVACAPIEIDDEVRGIIYVDNKNIKNLFDDFTGDLVRAFSEQMAIALKNASLFKDLRQSHKKLAAELRDKYQFRDIIGSSRSMTEVLQLVGDVAETDATILIQSENGTGKELIARALHYNSSRNDKPLETVNCGALPEGLIESALFGHRRGAFTGAVRDRRGKFELADQGTIFLDEVGEMSLNAQVKLLRVLENGSYYSVGSEEEKQCDVRVIAATNCDLNQLISQKKFREDLYYRLNVITLTLPPLRKRREDIPLLIEHFIEKYNNHKRRPKFSRQVEHILGNYHYPGNVRQLENIIHRAVILCKGKSIELRHLPSELLEPYQGRSAGGNGGVLTFQDRKKRTIEEFEISEIRRILAETGGKIRESARLSGMDVKNFSDKMRRYKINAMDFKS